MPCWDSIIGMPGIAIERVSLGNRIEVTVRYEGRPVCVHCGAGQCRIKASFLRRLLHTRQGPRLMVLLVRSHKYFCRLCRRYFNLRLPGVLPRRRSTENFRLEVYEKHHGGVSQRQLARTHGIGEATVERWYRDFVVYRVKELKGRSSPRVLGIDEHFFTRKKGYATTFCDLANRKIYDVALGRSESALASTLAKIPGRDRTRAVVMDLSETYRQIVRKHFPNAVIVADRFHVVRLVNHAFLKAWQALDAIGRKNRGLLSLMRRHEKNLEPHQRQSLAHYLRQRPVLAEIYRFKQELNAILLQRQRSKATLRPFVYRLVEMIEQLKQTSLEPMRKLGETLDRWQEEIGRMMRFSRSNGITEGFHTKMEMLSRRAFGFRNFQNYRLRVLAHCGWDGIFTRVENRTPGTLPPSME